ncbi:CHASE2 domain-containing protein [Nostoc sp. CHAB 5836]|uniref:CHASE2 domain-containing protein n=1 Tax=Nostoc sp. CHAB 5836 TaxID=2780404 RepID=UPI001E352FD3|nr:CHASE2 domain-containing protein [Nostoc sp. CHAB 5836]MCC5618022.1 CHASE2 domain-containing protein [Nostoc sp. CHAB 5836]
MTNQTIFKLKVRQITSTCNFELSWGDGLVIDVNVNYPFSLTQSYENWHRAYLDYYVRLRGKKGISGTGSAPRDFHKQLVETEAQLLHEFQQWLLSPELVSINRAISKAVSQTSEKQLVEIFLTCTPIEIARLPWESWDIYFDTDSDSPKKIRIARSPANISNEVMHPVRRKIRVLVILGDDSGLDLEGDKQAVKSLNSIVDVKFVGWNRKTDTTNFDANALKHQIIKAISDDRGWDILFFAGHSNETQLTGGELGIAPGVALSMQEIEGSLKIARKRGLQFAIFNSCNGINIAEFLINLGLSQVAVMREPIHDKVAPIFLVKFLQSLAEYKDVHTALLDASQLLKEDEKRLSYPSAYLVPSLFRHPEAELFQIQPFNITSRIKRWLPTKLEAKWLGGLLLLSLLPPVQSLLLEPRILVQAIYRQITFQKPVDVETDLLVVQIDQESIDADSYPNKNQIYPIDYSYLAALVNRLSLLDARIIGIDFILDDTKQPNNSLKLRQSVQNAVKKNTWFIFATEEGEKTPRSWVSKDIADSKWGLSGEISSDDWYVELLPINDKNIDIYPFSYMLALATIFNKDSTDSSPTPSLPRKIQLQTEAIEHLNNYKNPNKTIEILRQNNFIKQWLKPVIDFSISPDKAYTNVSACKLLGDCDGKGDIPQNLRNKTILIIPGGYKGAGLKGKNEDNFPIPLSVAFWRGWGNGTMPGGEAHAYIFHHLMKPRLVVPVPDVWMIFLVAPLAKFISLTLIENPYAHKKIIKIVSANTIIFLLITLQIYISTSILIPCFLPSILVCKYIHFAIRRQSDE